MAQEKVVIKDLPSCGCGKSLHMPYCDGSHGRTPQQYEDWKRQTEQENKTTNSQQK